MLRDELKEMTLQAMDQKEYNDIVEKMKDAAKLGLNYIEVSNINGCVIRKLRSEGILICDISTKDKECLYHLSWIIQ